MQFNELVCSSIQFHISLPEQLTRTLQYVFFLIQMKEEVPLDDTYAILKRVAAGEFVFIDYKNGVGPQIEIKYKQGDKTFIHFASHRWAKFSGKYSKVYYNILTLKTEKIG